MAAAAMVTVTHARDRARTKVERDQRDWAAQVVGAQSDAQPGALPEPVLEIVLHPPTERAVLADQAGAIAWVRAWREVAEAHSMIEVTWGARQWPSVGTQSVPERCVLRGADTIAAFAGAAVSRAWATLRDRAAALRREFVASDETASGLAAAVRSYARVLQLLLASDFDTLIQVVTWLREHPSSGWRVRQLPIRGIDTKWLEQHRAVVEGLHAAISGRDSLGLLAAPNLVRVRFLDLTLRPGGLCDVVAPVEELAALNVAPETIFVFENLETMFSMPDVPGAVVVHGGGYGVGRLAQIPWIKHGRILYWGDLDSDGFAILHRLRSSCENVTSILMDESTLLAHRDLWVPEKKAAGGSYPSLTGGEQRALERIRAEGNVRLEQERIAWQLALPVLLAAAIR